MDDPLRLLPGYALRRASAAQMAAFNVRLAPLGLKFAEASVILVIAANPGATLSAIGRTLDIQRANMTPLVARLEERGLITRAAVNGRSWGLALSADGQKLKRGIDAAVHAHEAALVAQVPAAHRAALLPILHALWASGTH